MEENYSEVNDSEEKILNDIIVNNRFIYAFQPIIEAGSGEIYGYEALMRNTYGKQYTPDRIIQYAANNHLLYEIEKATFENVLSKFATEESHFYGRKVFINSIPGYQLNEEDYLRIYEKYADSLTKCVIEITEATELVDEELEALLKRANKAGFELALDDYGTGYSNTTNLLRHLPKYVKMDHLLISDIHSDSKKQHFVKSMVEFGHANGMLVLAEGVENIAELKTVIQLGIDLIQGFYTAVPSFTILEEIDPQVRNEIINANVRGQTQNNRKIYSITEDSELPLMRIALEKNTGILIDTQKVTLVGNQNYTAAMTIKIKDGCDTVLTIRDIMLESFQDMPCIELGEKSHVVLVLEGENYLQKVGICVPKSSSLEVIGSGNLFIHAIGIEGYAIGNTWDSFVGDISLSSSGEIKILVESNESIGIGGGSYTGSNGIMITAGKVQIESASEKAIGIGCVHHAIPIRIEQCEIQMDLRIDKGLAIGCMDADQDIFMRNCNLLVEASGNELSCLGSNHSGAGRITVENGFVSATMNGQHINMIGSDSGKLSIELQDSVVELVGEGRAVMGIGTRDEQALIHIIRCNCNIRIRSGNHVLYGAKEENVHLDGGYMRSKVNE